MNTSDAIKHGQEKYNQGYEAGADAQINALYYTLEEEGADKMIEELIELAERNV